VSTVVYIVRHGEVEHHRSDVGLTRRGREQAHAAGCTLGNDSRAGDTIRVLHSPVRRAAETAESLYESLAMTFRRDGGAAPGALVPPRPDPALHNLYFFMDPGRQPQEPSALFAEMSTAACQAKWPPARAGFYRGFWSSPDPMGYWLMHDSGGGAESPEAVHRRVKARLHDIFSRDSAGRAVHILVTHSGPMRALLRAALGTDPGEPDFCEILALEPSDDPHRAIISYRGEIGTVSLG
jgi:broad specificity phosphatase PhoE